MRYTKEPKIADAVSISRRVFFKKTVTLGAGFTLAMMLPGCVAAGFTPDVAEGELMANAFVRISPDNTVTIIIKHIEFGQGTFTGLATIAAEEMEAGVRKAQAAVPQSLTPTCKCGKLGLVRAICWWLQRRNNGVFR